MIKIGITGSIAMGKTTISKKIQREENQVIDDNRKDLLAKKEKVKTLKKAQSALRNIVSITASIKKFHNWT